MRLSHPTAFFFIFKPLFIMHFRTFITIHISIIFDMYSMVIIFNKYLMHSIYDFMQMKIN
jgi:hypothetical protein